jgi:CheY-like chemotaxis protein
MAKVVFCEDSAVIQKLIGLALRSTAHEVHIASDGAAGLEIIERERPDAVFTDVSMPNMDGFQLADALKARPHLAHIPIVIMTATGDQEQLDEGHRHGAVDHFAKPFNAADLRAKVDEVAGRARSE